MLGRTNAGGGGSGGKIEVLIYGGKGEIVTYTGAVSGSVTLDSTGTGVAVLKKGSYSFSAGTSGLSIAKLIDKGATVRLRPAHFIFWYGAVNGEIVKDSNYGTLTLGDTTLKLQNNSDGDPTAIHSDIDCSQDTKITLKVTDIFSSGGYIDMRYSSSMSSSGGGSKNINSTGTYSLTYTYNASYKPRIRVNDYQWRKYQVTATEWYLGNREAA